MWCSLQDEEMMRVTYLIVWHERQLNWDHVAQTGWAMWGMLTFSWETCMLPIMWAQCVFMTPWSETCMLPMMWAQCVFMTTWCHLGHMFVTFSAPMFAMGTLASYQVWWACLLDIDSGIHLYMWVHEERNSMLKHWHVAHCVGSLALVHWVHWALQAWLVTWTCLLDIDSGIHLYIWVHEERKSMLKHWHVAHCVGSLALVHWLHWALQAWLVTLSGNVALLASLRMWLQKTTPKTWWVVSFIRFCFHVGMLRHCHLHVH